MTCRDLCEKLLEYVEGELDGQTCECFEQHLRTCGPCAIYVETYRLTIQLSRKLPNTIDVPDGLLARCSERLRQNPAQPGQSATGIV